MKQKIMNEDVSAGIIGTGNIAVNFSSPVTHELKVYTLRDLLNQKSKKKKKHKIPFAVNITEAFDVSDVISKLRSTHNKPRNSAGNVTYGIEDESGNIMKVTVPKDQAVNFENRLGEELSNINTFSIIGDKSKNISMAELLFSLKDQFTIIDVEFPKIPTDVVYNADDASYDVNTNEANDKIDFNVNDMFDDDSGLGIDDNDESLDDKESFDDDVDNVDDADDLDVEEFVEPDETVESSILDRVLAMLKSQADAEKAKADAAAEESRAKQAEYSARAATTTIEHETELARIEQEIEIQKEKEKQAKKLADIAKYRVSKASSITESDEGETTASIRRLLADLPIRWKIEPTDDPRTQAYKNQQRRNSMTELQARMRSAMARERYNAVKRQEQTKNAQDNQNKNTQNGNNQNNTPQGSMK